jgi:hypothetical protein
LLGASLQVPEVCLGSPEVEPWVSERALGGDSGFGGEGISILESPSHAVGLELSSLLVVESCLGESSVERSADEGFALGVEPTPLAVIPAEESGFPPCIVVPTSEDFIAIDAGDGSSQMPAFGFLVPFAEEFFGFLSAGSLSKDWEDFYSSQGGVLWVCLMQSLSRGLSLFLGRWKCR